jgi:uncharacterized Tic20 family protein
MSQDHINMAQIITSDIHYILPFVGWVENTHILKITNNKDKEETQGRQEINWTIDNTIILLVLTIIILITNTKNITNELNHWQYNSINKDYYTNWYKEYY